MTPSFYSFCIAFNKRLMIVMPPRFTAKSIEIYDGAPT